MENQSQVYRGQKLIAFILGNVVEQACGCELILQSTVDEMTQYPFITFQVISPENDSTSDWLEDDRQFTVDFQIDAHAGDFYTANDIAMKLYEALHDYGYRRFFRQANIVVVSTTQTSNRTTLEGINYDHDVGFDCSFLITGLRDYKDTDLNFSYDKFNMRTASAGTANVTNGTVTSKGN